MKDRIRPDRGDRLMVLQFEDILERLKSRIIRLPPDDCWIWTGSNTRRKIEIISKTRRDKDFSPERVPSVVKPYATFRHKGKLLKVHKFLGGADSRMENHCGNTLCVNPDHWKSQIVEDKPFFDPETEIEDARRVIDGIGIARNLSLENLLNHPLLVDYSPEAIEQAWKELK